jgi:serine/threonine-protein kinase
MSRDLSPSRLQRVRQLFDDALECDPATREAFLRHAAGGDEELRREVASLLAALDAGDTDGASLESPASAILAHAVAPVDEGARLTGHRIGSYDIVRLIGYGGMGAVYEGVRADLQYHKRVAIKLLRRGIEGDLAIRRFRYERQILATLNHRNISALLDGGVTPDGQPYIVMEYVEGQPISVFANAQRLSLRDRLGLFRQVCAAVQHAHQNLVVHRDLKPGNILVASDGTVKLLDFGIAKLLRESEGLEQLPVTRGGMRALTPEYASPEHLRGLPISAASDVYSLGVILFELLTGDRPFRFDGLLFSEVEQTVCERPAPFPSTCVSDARAQPFGERRARRIRRQLTGDLDAIVVKALRKEPERRYGSAQQLSDDLQRYLDGLPVTAQRDSVAYRLTKFVRRHRWQVAASLLFIGSLGGGIVTTLRQARRAEAERGKALQINQFLIDMLGSVNPEINSKDITVRQVLDDAARRIDANLTAQPEEQASIRETIGRSYQSLGLYAEAEHQLRLALATRRQLFGGDHPDVARTLSGVASALEYAGHLDSAETYWTDALAMWRRVRSGDDAESATLLDGVARLRERKGDLKGAEALHREVLALRRRVLGSEHIDVANSLNNLAVALGQQGELAAAESLHVEAVAVTQRVHGAEHPLVATALSSVASVLEYQGKNREADSVYRVVLAMRRKLLGADHPDYAWTAFNYAFFQIEQGRYADAVALCREIVALRGRTLQDSHPGIASCLQTIGRGLDRLGDLVGGGRALRESYEVRRRTLPTGHWLIYASQSVLGEHELLARRYAEAERLLLPSYYKLLELRGPKATIIRDVRVRIAKLYEAWGKPARAQEFRALLSDR